MPVVLVPSDGCVLLGERRAEASDEETDLLLAFSAGAAALVEVVRPAEPRPVIIPGHRCFSTTATLLAGDSEGRAFSHWSPVLFVLPLRGLLFLSATAPGLSLACSVGKPWTSLSTLLAGDCCTGSGRGRSSRGDELRADAHRSPEAFLAFLARGGVLCPSAAASRGGTADEDLAAVEGCFSREDNRAGDDGAAGLARSADRALLLHVAKPPSAAEARPGLGDLHRLAAGTASAGAEGGGATGLNREGPSVLRPAGAALFFSDGASGRRGGPSAAAAAAVLRSAFTASMKTTTKKNSSAPRVAPPTSVWLSSSYARPSASASATAHGKAKPRGSTGKDRDMGTWRIQPPG